MPYRGAGGIACALGRSRTGVTRCWQFIESRRDTGRPSRFRAAIESSRKTDHRAGPAGRLKSNTAKVEQPPGRKLQT